MLFDYVFYRLFLFFKSRGDDPAGTSALLTLSLMQCLTLLDVVLLGKVFFIFSFPPKAYFAVVLIGVAAWNWYKYNHKVELVDLEQKWKSESPAVQSAYGWGIGLYLLACFSVPIVYGYVTHNLKK